MNIEKIISECTFKSSRSRGPGGQHVNKTESRITLFFNVITSEGLNEEEKYRIVQGSSNKNAQGDTIQISVSDTRSQIKNKQIAINRLIELLKQKTKIRKKRKPTKTPKKAIEKRLKQKKGRSEVKKTRKRINKSDL